MGGPGVVCLSFLPVVGGCACLTNCLTLTLTLTTAPTGERAPAPRSDHCAEDTAELVDYLMGMLMEEDAEREELQEGVVPLLYAFLSSCLLLLLLCAFPFLPAAFRSKGGQCTARLPSF